MDRAALEAARPEDLVEAAEAYEALAGLLKDLQEQWRVSVADRVHGAGWQGLAGELAARAIEGAALGLRSAEEDLEVLRDTLREAAEAIATACSAAAPEGSDPGERADRRTADRLARLTESARSRRPTDPRPAASPARGPVPPHGNPPRHGYGSLLVGRAVQQRTRQ